ncbi:bifunctional monodehydroascorbate reductase and carbonic anhydrase nectarin-3 [Tanacetum coccineum]
MDNKSLWFSSILIALFIIFCVPFVTSQEVDDEHEFTYDVNSPNGPHHWGEIHSEWSMCNQGDLQSPVDLLHKRVETTSSLGRLDRDYKPANSTIVNRGHDMMMEPYFKALASTKDVEKNVGIIDPRQIKVGSRKYYRYIGSLTTPPCTQNVIWTIVNKVRTVSREQLHAIREAVHDDAEVNSRAVQPLNNRW